MRGIGKTYGLALFVFLMRCNSEKRVLYIHNPKTFTSNSYTCLNKNLPSAFPEEFEQNEDLREMLDSLRELMTNR